MQKLVMMIVNFKVMFKNIEKMVKIIFKIF